LALFLVVVMQDVLDNAFNPPTRVRGVHAGWWEVPEHLLACLPRTLHNRFFLVMNSRVFADLSELLQAAYDDHPDDTTNTYWDACVIYHCFANGDVNKVLIDFPFQQEYDEVAAAAPRDYDDVY
jgi:hypothetical protein